MKLKANLYQHTCAKCGYTWRSRLASPKECPDCKQRHWSMQQDGKARRRAV